MRKFVSVLLMFCLLWSVAFQVNGAESETGSIEITVKYGDAGVTGGDLMAVRVGYADLEQNCFRKFITDEEITGIGEASTVTQLQDFYEDNQNGFRFEVYKTEITDGIGAFPDVPLGMYLIYQQTPAPGFYKLPAFLVTVPYDGEWNVAIVSKTELEKETEPTEKPTAPTTPDDPKLPQTGQLTWPIPWLAVTGTALFALGWWLCFRRKEETQ